MGEEAHLQHVGRMNTIGRYISAFLLAVPAASLLAYGTYGLAVFASRGEGPTGKIFTVSFLVGLALLTPLVSTALVSWNTSGIVNRIVTAFPMSLPLSLFLVFATDSAAKWLLPDRELGVEVGIPVIIASLAVPAIWIAGSSEGRQAASRGCGLIALTAFAIPIYAIGSAYISPPDPSPIIPLKFWIWVSIVLGVPASIVYAMLRWPLRGTG